VGVAAAVAFALGEHRLRWPHHGASFAAPVGTWSARCGRQNSAKQRRWNAGPRPCCCDRIRFGVSEAWAQMFERQIAVTGDTLTSLTSLPPAHCHQTARAPAASASAAGWVAARPSGDARKRTAMPSWAFEGCSLRKASSNNFEGAPRRHWPKRAVVWRPGSAVGFRCSGLRPSSLGEGLAGPLFLLGQRLAHAKAVFQAGWSKAKACNR